MIDVANIEASYFSEWLERDSFRELPASMELAAGIVDEANYWVEPVSKIRGAPLTGHGSSARSGLDLPVMRLRPPPRQRPGSSAREGREHGRGGEHPVAAGSRPAHCAARSS